MKYFYDDSINSSHIFLLSAISGVSLFFEVLMSWENVAGRVQEGRQSGQPRKENFLEQGSKQGLLVHF